MKFASIDIGSNAVRLLISSWTPDNINEPFKRVEFVRVPLRLGDDAFRDKKISKEKKQLLYKAMEAFRLLMDVHGVDDYMACATTWYIFIQKYNAVGFLYRLLYDMSQIKRQ